MKNEHSSDGIAEDLIRSFLQAGCAELHAKTLYEKASSELSNQRIDIEDPNVLQKQQDKMEDYYAQIQTYAQWRREDMLYLYQLYGSKGDKQQWCMVKHLGLGAMTAFEAWQASDDDMELFGRAEEKNAAFIKAMAAFLGVEITECAACFADILKGGIS